jgi:hypothetical protein
MNIEQICKDVLDLDKSIRFAMIVQDGIKKFGGYRYDTVAILNSEELDQSIWYAHERMAGRILVEHKLGKTKYAMAEYEKVKRITFPLNNKTLLLVSLDVKSDHDKIIKNVLKRLKQN